MRFFNKLLGKTELPSRSTENKSQIDLSPGKEKCICNKYSDILDYGALTKRFKDTKNIFSYLTLIAEHPEKEHRLYQCETCGQLWQRSLSWMDGNEQYIFKVPKINIGEWKEKPFVQPDDLFVRTGVVRQYLERAIFEEQNVICRHAGCTHYSIKLSVFCVIHHMESIGIKLTLPDNNTWFPPFEKELVELTYERLSELPNYKKYQ